MSKHFVSFCLLSYKQPEYIKLALDGAFAQTYRPMEIVISDDCSGDDSCAVIKAKIDAYKNAGGDIPIVFVQNDINHGFLGNWEVCCKHAKGELLVKADGDDISMPNRIERIVDEWMNADCKPLVIFHSAYKINAKGQLFGRMKKSVAEYGPVGAIVTYSRKVLELFGPIVVTDRKTDESVYGGRSDILGGERLWIDEPLVLYRVGSGVSSGITGFRRFMSRGVLSRMPAIDQILIDLDSCHVTLNELFKSEYRQKLNDEKSRLQTQLKLWQGVTFSERLAAYRKLKPTIHGLPQQIIHRLLLLGRLSEPIFDGIKLAKYLIDRIRFKRESHHRTPTPMAYTSSPRLK